VSFGAFLGFAAFGDELLECLCSRLLRLDSVDVDRTEEASVCFSSTADDMVLYLVMLVGLAYGREWCVKRREALATDIYVDFLYRDIGMVFVPKCGCDPQLPNVGFSGSQCTRYGGQLMSGGRIASG
jgi:hypothetical protein